MHETSAFEDPEVVGEQIRGDGESALQFRRRCVAEDEHVHDRQPCRIGQGAIESGALFERELLLNTH